MFQWDVAVSLNVIFAKGVWEKDWTLKKISIWLAFINVAFGHLSRLFFHGMQEFTASDKHNFMNEMLNPDT